MEERAFNITSASTAEKHSTEKLEPTHGHTLPLQINGGS